MGSLDAIKLRKRPAFEVEWGVRRVRSWPLLILGGWIIQAVIRLAFTLHHRVPILIPDETGFLLAARLVTGGAAGNLSGCTLYQAGYALVIAPAFLLSHDPMTVYRLV